MNRSRDDWYALLDSVRHGHVPHRGRRSIYDDGIRIARRLRERGVWKPGERIVDWGCGNGRLAIGIAACLEPEQGEFVHYLGLDCVPESIEFCRRAFGPHKAAQALLGLRGSTFRFQHADVFNEFYNPAGRIRPERAHAAIEWILEEGAHDVVIANSLFTHLGSGAACRSHLDAFSRLLRPSGRAWTTWFRSPPHPVDASCRKTVFPESEIRALVAPRWRVIDERGCTDRKQGDQWILHLRKKGRPLAAHAPSRGIGPAGPFRGTST